MAAERVLVLPAGAVSEKSWQSAVVEYARLTGWLVYHTHDSRRSEPGYPDLTMVRQGRLVFAELKTDKGKLRPEQQTWIRELQECEHSLDDDGRVYFPEVHVWRPRDIGEVERILR